MKREKRALSKTFTVHSEKGSLALEQVLFIGAIVAMSVGLFVFYGNLREYFNDIDVSSLPETVADPASSGSN